MIERQASRIKGLETRSASLQDSIDEVIYRPQSADVPAIDEYDESGSACGTLFGSVDYLYLTASGPDTTYTVDNVNSGGIATVPNGSVYNVSSDSDSALRLILGYRLGNGLEFVFRYTRFEQNSTDARTALAGGNLETSRLQPDNTSRFATGASANADVELEIFDLEVGSWLDLSDAIAARPFVGMRFGQVDRTLRTRYTVGGASRFAQDTAVLDVFGLRTGSDVRWQLFRQLSLEGGAAVSLLAGRNVSRHAETGALTPSDVRDDFNSFVPVLDAYVGLVYEHCNFSMAAGYEMSGWINSGSYLTFIDDIADGQHVRDSHDLLLSGLYVRMGWNWGGSAN